MYRYRVPLWIVIAEANVWLRFIPNLVDPLVFRIIVHHQLFNKPGQELGPVALGHLRSYSNIESKLMLTNNKAMLWRLFRIPDPIWGRVHFLLLATDTRSFWNIPAGTVIIYIFEIVRFTLCPIAHFYLGYLVLVPRKSASSSMLAIEKINLIYFYLQLCSCPTGWTTVQHLYQRYVGWYLITTVSL